MNNTMRTLDDLLDRLGDALRDTHTIKRELGGGGMSHVFLAEETSLGRDVVIKVLPPMLAASVSADRFAREIRVAARLQQANIVPVLSAGVAGGVPYYTMPYVAGESLRDLLRRTPQLSVAQVLAITTDVARALSYAHENGIVHRDIKPENVLLSGGTAVVTDFGVAKALAVAKHTGGDSASVSGDSTHLTLLGTSLGTPAYMAPEQALGDPTTDHRADIYALGLTMYEMLAGAHPFGSKLAHELMAAHITEQPTPIERKRSDLPAGVAQIVARCMGKDRNTRPATAASLLDDLSRINLSVRVSAEPGSNHKGLLGVAAVAAAVVVGIAATMYALGDSIATSDDLDPARVVVAAPVVDGSDGGLAPLATQANDLLVRTVQSVQAIRSVDVVAGARGDDELRARARRLGARTVVATSVSAHGPDSARFRFRIVDAGSGSLVRALRAIDVRRTANDAALRGALDPVFAVVAIVTERALGPAALPVGEPPSFHAARELATGLQLASVSGGSSTRSAADSVRRGLAMTHIDEAVKSDPAFLQARLWQTQFVQDNYPPTYYLRSRVIGDTVMRELAPQMERLSNFERTLYDYVVASHLGRVPEVIQALRRMRAAAPEASPAALLPRILMDQNRPREALQIVRSAPPSRDAAGNLIPAKDDVARWTLIASISHYLGDQAANIEAANELHRLAPDVMSTARVRLIAAAWGGDSAHIRDILDVARSLPSRPGTYDFFGDLQMQIGQELMAHGHEALGRQLVHEAIEWLDAHPSTDRRYDYRKALAYFALADYKRADETLAPLVGDTTASSIIGLDGRIAAHLGDTARAMRRWRELERIDNAGLLGAPMQERAFIAAALGRKAEAVELLQDAFVQGIGWNIWWRLHWFPDTAPLRGYPPFDRLLEPKG